MKVEDWRSLFAVVVAGSFGLAAFVEFEALVGEAEISRDCRAEICDLSARRSGAMDEGSGFAERGDRARREGEGGRRSFSHVWRSVWSLLDTCQRLC